MADLKTLSEELKKLSEHIDRVMVISGYREDYDLSELAGEVNTADECQLFDAFCRILYRLDGIYDDLEYYYMPVVQVGTLSKDDDGRFRTDKGYCYTCGSRIEFLRTTEIWNEDTDEHEEARIWTVSRVEGMGERYYIVGYPDVELSGLTVRIRG